MKKAGLLIWMGIAGMMMTAPALAAPPAGRPQMETLSEKALLALGVRTGYEYYEYGQGDAATTVGVIPLRLQAQLTPLLEMRGGVVTEMYGGGGDTILLGEASALLTFLPPTLAFPGFGLFVRGVAPMNDENSPHFADLDTRLVSTISLLDFLILDLNLGYWMGLGSETVCAGTEAGETCVSSSTSYLPVMAGLRVSLFDLLSLYGRSEMFFDLDQEFDDVYNKGVLGGTVALGDSLSLDVNMGIGLSDTTEDLSVRTELRWNFLEL